MKKAMVACLLVALCGMVVRARSLGELDYAIVPSADMVYLQDTKALETSAFGKQAMKKQDEWSKKMQGQGGRQAALDDIRARFMELWTKFGLQGANQPQLGLMALSVALHGTAEKPFGAVDMLLGMECTQISKLTDQAVTEALELAWKLFELKQAGLTYKLSFQHGTQFRSATVKLALSDSLQDGSLPSGMDTWTILWVEPKLVLMGPKTSVDKAFKRYQEKRPVVLDPYLANNLAGDCAYALRMLPAMRTFMKGMASQDMPALGALSKGAGMAFNCTVTDKLAMEFSFRCASAQDAMAFQTKVWNTQFAPLVGMLGGMLKAQSNNAITCFDGLKCVTDGSAIRFQMPLTIRDIDGFAAYVERQRLAQEARVKAAAERAKKKAQKKAQKKATAPKQVAPKQVAPKQVAPKQVAPKQVAPKQVVPKQAAPAPVKK